MTAEKELASLKRFTEQCDLEQFYERQELTEALRALLRALRLGLEDRECPVCTHADPHRANCEFSRAETVLTEQGARL